MNPIVKNIIAVVLGLIVGGIVNMSLIMLSPHLIAPPAGADVTTEEGLKASMHLFQPKHFIMPFLAHALGTFAGALLASIIAANRKMMFAMIIGILFLLGGFADVYMLPAPMWYNVLDLMGAYIPMAFIAGKLGMRKKENT